MSLLDKLSQAKSTLDNLLAFANNKTGKSDTSIGDAIKTLVDGYGSGGTPFAFGGMNAELVSEYDEDFTLDDTSFEKGKSASTSSEVILAPVNNKYTNTTGSPTYAYDNKDVVIVQTLTTEVTHEEGTTGARQIKSIQVQISHASKRKTSDTSKKTTRTVFYTSTTNSIKYYNSSNVISRAAAVSYGFYANCTTPTFASNTANSTYVRVGSPTISYRASGTYESTTNIKKVTDVKYHWSVKVYAVDQFTSITSAINDLHDAWLTD